MSVLILSINTDLPSIYCTVIGPPSTSIPPAPSNILETALFELVKGMVEHQQSTIDTQAELMRQMMHAATVSSSAMQPESAAAQGART